MDSAVAAWAAIGVIVTAFCGMVGSIAVALIGKPKKAIDGGSSVTISPGIPIVAKATLEDHLREEAAFWQNRYEVLERDYAKRGIPLPYFEGSPLITETET